MISTPAYHTFSARLDCRYILQVPSQVNDRTLLVVTLHGYGSNPEVMLRLTHRMMGDGHVIASLQGPNQHYLTPNTPDSEVGYNWGVRGHGESSIVLHHEMMLQLFEQLRNRFSISARNTLLIGFSQPVGFNYRFAGTYPDQLGGLIGICGGVPKNWEEGSYQPVSPAMLHIAREEDEFYAPEITATYPDRLRAHARDVEFHLLPGGHRFPSQANPIVAAWLERVFPERPQR